MAGEDFFNKIGGIKCIENEEMEVGNLTMFNLIEKNL